MRKMKTRMDNEAAKEMLNEVFSNVGKHYGYANVSADFVAFKQFKVQWQRSYNWISFRISDYMVDAPENVMEDLANSLFEKISGQKGQYSSGMRDWVLSDEFSISKRPTFIKRGRYLSSGSEGEYKDLDDAIGRLVANGMLPYDHNIAAVWNRDTRTDLAATYSVLMRTIMVSSALDEPDTPDSTLDYVIYNQYLRIKENARVFGTDEEPKKNFDEDLSFPGYMDAENELDRLCLAL